MRIYEIGVQINGETYVLNKECTTLHDALAAINTLRFQSIFDRFTLRSYCI